MKDLLQWNVPDETVESGFALMLHRSLPFGGTRNTVFFVDDLEYLTAPGGEKPYAIKACRGGRLIVAFPAEAAYILVERDRVTLSTLADIITSYNAERKEITQLEKQLTAEETEGREAPSGPPAIPMGHGQYL